MHRRKNIQALVGFCLDLDGLGTLGHSPHRAVEPVLMWVDRVQLLLVHVVHIQRARCGTPGNLAVGTEQHHGVRKGGVSGHIETCAMQADAKHV
ncbi:hypothetical protein D3C72_1050620 [compost metagenome]